MFCDVIVSREIDIPAKRFPLQIPCELYLAAHLNGNKESRHQAQKICTVINTESVSCVFVFFPSEAKIRIGLKKITKVYGLEASIKAKIKRAKNISCIRNRSRRGSKHGTVLSVSF